MSERELCFYHNFLEEISIIKLPVHPQLAKTTLFSTLKQCGYHLANGFPRLPPLFLRSDDQGVRVDALQASKAFENEAIVDELPLRVECR